MKNKKLNSLILSLILTGFVVFLTTSSCLAMNSLVDTSGGTTGAYATGNYSLDHVRNYLIYLIFIILSLVGSLSLLAFVYGGVTFLISAGNPETVKKGIEILKAAVVGLLIVFTSVLIVNLFFGGLGITWNSKTGSVNQEPTTNVTDSASTDKK